MLIFAATLLFTGATPPAPERIQQAPVDLNAPGPEHAALDPLAGVWDVTILFPDGRGGHMQGRATCQGAWTFDRRFLRLAYTSSIGGRPLEVVRYLGFDRHRGRYVEIHFESTHTDVLRSEGTVDLTRRTFSATGLHQDVIARRNTTVRTLTSIASQDAFTIEMAYLDESGTPARTVTLRHQRAGAR
ncbi:MAG: DUF1579 family protein [Acidobacteriota bacterium]